VKQLTPEAVASSVAKQFTPSALMPGLAQFRNYQRSYLRGDILGGLTVAAYLVPQVMAYATLVGVPAINGLWCALPPLVLYAIFGTSRLMSAGPESTVALMTGTAIAPLAGGDMGVYLSMCAILAILVGAMCYVAGVIRLGFLADLLSKPILAGYMAGLAVIMIASQLGKFTGAPVTGDEVIDEVTSLWSVRDQIHNPTLMFSMALLAVLLIFAKVIPRLPGPLFAVLLATAAVSVFGLEKYGIKTIGEIPGGLPPFSLAHIEMHWNDLNNLAAVAVGITIVGFADTVATARSFAMKDGSKIDGNAELRAMGIYNIGSAMTQGFPVSSSASRTALGFLIGARTQMYSLVAFVGLVVILLTATGLLAHFPKAALGALVVYAGLRLIDIREFKRLFRFRRDNGLSSEFVLAVLTFLAVLLLGVLYGVIAAVGISILNLLRRVARPHDAVQGFVPGMAGMHDIDDYKEATLEPGLLVYRYDAPLFFANAENFAARALKSVDENPDPVEWFILNAEANSEMDLTAIDALDSLRQELATRGIHFGMARVKSETLKALQVGGQLDEIGVENIYPTLPTAVAAYRNRGAANSAAPSAATAAPASTEPDGR
jgi:high affinity sulfate transporter 1